MISLLCKCLRFLVIAGGRGIGDNKTQMVIPNPAVIDLSKNCVKFNNCCFSFVSLNYFNFLNKCPLVSVI